MNFLKKILSSALAAVMIFSLCSCSSSRDSREQTAPPTVRITFPEGTTATQTAELLEENGVCTVSEFISAVNSRESESELTASLPNPDDRAFLLEGYIFPDTYDFYVGEGASKALSRFLANMKSKLTEDMYKRAEQLGFTMDEILTIASIVQEESLTHESMKNVSSVIHNRLNSESYPRLQCDVSVFYLKLYVKPYISGENTDRYDALYNTYECSGLPAGPITNPGIDAINAALYPADTDYYFFVTDSSGNYYYAKTYAEHLENCKIAGIE